VRAPFVIFAASIIAVAACGARSSLRVDDVREQHDAGVEEEDAHDAAPDVFDAPPDVFDAPPDVEPPFDAPDICADAGTTFIYVVSSEYVLYRFYPPEASFVEIGPIDCPAVGNATPFSMAVDRKGIAYVLYNDGELFRMSTAKPSACVPTGFVVNQDGFSSTFGMGFSANVTDPGETLYVASDTNAGPTGAPESLATIDTDTYQLSTVGQFSSVIGNAELTGAGDGSLYAFGIDQGPSGPILHLAQIDKPTAKIIDDTYLNLGTGGQNIVAWAFAYWGGDFYFFTSVGGGSSKVSRYHPGDTQAVDYATLGNTIVGAGVSTCAPQQ
jgi:hypothetical protein